MENVSCKGTSIMSCINRYRKPDFRKIQTIFNLNEISTIFNINDFSLAKFITKEEQLEEETTGGEGGEEGEWIYSEFKENYKEFEELLLKKNIVETEFVDSSKDILRDFK